MESGRGRREEEGKEEFIYLGIPQCLNDRGERLAHLAGERETEDGVDDVVG